jgi:hypothetical protein
VDGLDPEVLGLPSPSCPVQVISVQRRISSLKSTSVDIAKPHHLCHPADHPCWGRRGQPALRIPVGRASTGAIKLLGV